MSFFGEDLEEGFYEYMLINEGNYDNKQIKEQMFIMAKSCEIERIAGKFLQCDMSFGKAFEEMRSGKRIARSGWKDKGSFLWYKPPQKVVSSICYDPVLKKIAEDNGGVIAACGVICFYTQDIAGRNMVMTGWHPDVADLCACDWMVVEE